MAETTIITGQFVRINQTPASVGERLIALAVDFILVGLYIYAMIALFAALQLPPDPASILFVLLVWLPALGYPLLCEVFNEGRSLGKSLMHIRVVKADGSTPGIGSYLLRWMLFPVDSLLTGGLGLLVVLLTGKSQRMGDLAAGTIVVKEQNYRKIHVTLDEFDYLAEGYRPTYPQAANLSLEQADVITRTLQEGRKERRQRMDRLARKVRELLSVTPRSDNPEEFLRTILRDYQYYALEEI